MAELTLIEAALQMRCHPATMRRLLTRGAIPYSRRFDGRIRIDLKDIKNFLRRTSRGAPRRGARR